MDVTFLTALLLFAGGFMSGVVNAVAGGGTFITFGALTLVGVPPISANATSAIAQFPGYVTSALAYRKDIARIWRKAISYALLSGAGALAGALLLLSFDNVAFKAIVPWLLIAATILFAAGPRLMPKRRTQDEAAPTGRALSGKLVQFMTSIYGGFFGAGMGIMMLATLGLTERGDYHHLNALKNLLSIVIAAVAIAVFVSGGVVAWREVAAIVPGVAAGGYSGVWAAKRLPLALTRFFVVAFGLFLACYYFYV
nr:sulfite exporter TauE/SafE family protein [Chelativorans sp. J32]